MERSRLVALETLTSTYTCCVYVALHSWPWLLNNSFNFICQLYLFVVLLLSYGIPHKLSDKRAIRSRSGGTAFEGNVVNRPRIVTLENRQSRTAVSVEMTIFWGTHVLCDSVKVTWWIPHN